MTFQEILLFLLFLGTFEYRKCPETGDMTKFFEHFKGFCRFTVSRHFWIRKVSINMRNDQILWIPMCQETWKRPIPLSTECVKKHGNNQILEFGRHGMIFLAMLKQYLQKNQQYFLKDKLKDLWERFNNILSVSNLSTFSYFWCLETEEKTKSFDYKSVNKQEIRNVSKNRRFDQILWIFQGIWSFLQFPDTYQKRKYI